MLVEKTIRDHVDEFIHFAMDGLQVEQERWNVEIRDGLTIEKTAEILAKKALENIDEANSSWTFVAARFMLQSLYHQAAKNRGYNPSKKYGNFYHLLETLTKEGIYTPKLMEKYSRTDIDYLAGKIEPTRDLMFTYLGIYTLANRYLATDHQKQVFELPQERWMVIAMHIMQDEDPIKRLDLVEEAYWALSNLYMTVATPTLANAGKTHGQLSSCFIDTVDDSLQSIYDSNTDIAKLSKNGGGIGVYMGKIRARGSAIKGFKGMSSGVVP